MADDIVKVKKSDLEKLLDANTKAYQILDEITGSAKDVAEMVNAAFSILEDAPREMGDIIIEEEEQAESEK